LIEERAKILREKAFRNPNSRGTLSLRPKWDVLTQEGKNYWIYKAKRAVINDDYTVAVV
jgi:hypothetical protein